MGFISKDITLKAYLTQKGKEYIIDGQGIVINQFLLGDSDANYNVEPEFSDVVDLSGREDCLKGISGNVTLKYPVFFSGDTTPNLNFIFNNQVVSSQEIVKENNNEDEIKLRVDAPVIDDLEVMIQLSSLTQFSPSQVAYRGDTIPFSNNRLRAFIFQGENESDTITLSYNTLPLVASGTTLNNCIVNVEIKETNQEIRTEINNFNIIQNGGIIPQINFTLRTQPSNINLNNGRIFIENIAGGQMPYRFTIIRTSDNAVIRNNVPITNVLSTQVLNIGAGTYRIIIQDINNYTTERQTVVSEIQSETNPLDFTIVKVRDAFDVIPLSNGIAELTSIQNGAGFPYELQLSATNGSFNQIFSVTSLPFRINALPPNTYNVVLRKGAISSPIRQLVIGTQPSLNLIIEPIKRQINQNEIIGFRIRNVVRLNSNPHSLDYLFFRIGTSFPRYTQVLNVNNLSEGLITFFNLPETGTSFDRFQNQVRFVEAGTNREVVYQLLAGEVIIPNQTS